MLELRDMLHLDVLTVTGRTLGKNLDEINQGFKKKKKKKDETAENERQEDEEGKLMA